MHRGRADGPARTHSPPRGIFPRHAPRRMRISAPIRQDREPDFGIEDAHRGASEVAMTATVLFLLPALALSATIAEARIVECAPHRFNTLHAPAIADFTTAV